MGVSLSSSLRRKLIVGSGTLAAAVLGVVGWFFSGSAGHHPHHHSPYAGQEQRLLKNFSAEDIRALQNGEGWGLAKAAELNGVPGPAHLLELAEEIALTAEQRDGIETIHRQMKAEAIRRGEELLALEKTLEEGFQRADLSEAALADLLQRIGAVRARLRYAHLAAHLQSAALLSAEQISRYNTLRGYQ